MRAHARARRQTDRGVHHGSGPRYTHLLDPSFPQRLAVRMRGGRALSAYRRVPPVNEPVTTARFSALYGFWYPHCRDDHSFVRVLMHQMLGIVLAMRAIRKVNSSAQLIQTDDLGFTTTPRIFSIRPTLRNSRRWLSFDLLTGRVMQVILCGIPARQRGERAGTGGLH